MNKETNNKSTNPIWIIILLLMVVAPYLVFPTIIVLVVYKLLKKSGVKSPVNDKEKPISEIFSALNLDQNEAKKSTPKYTFSSTPKYTSTGTAGNDFDSCPDTFCFHKDKGVHHVYKGKEIDPWDRPDTDIRKYQHK